MTFHSPVWLYVIPPALLVLGFIFHLASRARKRQLGKFAADRLLSGLLRSYSPGRRRFKQLLIAAGVALILVALARPQYGYTWKETSARGIDVLFVLDSSKSMLAQDIRPNRLERAKFAILDFVERIPGDRVGLVAFAGNAFLQCPLTLDYDAFRLSLEAVDTEVIPHGGTDIARALIEAEQAFSEDNNHKVVVLITDGEDLEQSGVEQARLLAQQGMTIYTVGVGTAEGELIPVESQRGRVEYLRDSDGKPVTTRLDEETLKDIAEATGGFYVPLGVSGYGLEQVFEAGLQSIPEQDLGSRRQKVWIERFQWPLGLGLFLLAWEPLVGTRRLFLRRRLQHGISTRNAAMIALLLGLGVFLSPRAARAQQSVPPTAVPTNIPAQDAASEQGIPEETEPMAPPPPPPDANPAKLYRSGNYTGAAHLYTKQLALDPTNAEASYNLGNSLYAQGKYEAAREAYRQSLGALDLDLQADAFYNLGNASYMLGKAALADVPPAAEVKQANEAAFSQTRQALDNGNAILKRADANRVPSTLRNEQTQQSTVPQQEIQQAIQQAEEAKKATEAAKEQSETAVTAGDSSSTFWQEAIDDYNSSLELAPESDDAAHNLDVAERKHSLQQTDNKELAKATERQAENIEVLDILIEELKKLLEEQQNQDDQNQQNQDQQNQDQNQQNDQNQSQDQQQQDQQQQNQQNNQQSSSDSSQQQNQDQSQQESQQDSGQQDEQNQQNQSQDQQSGQEDQQQQPKDESADQQEKGEQEQSDEQDSQKPDENTSGESESGQEQQEDKGQQPEQEQNDQGQADEQAQQQPEPQPGDQGQAGDEQQDQQGAGEQGLSEEQLEELSEQVAREQATQAEQQGEEKAAAAAGKAGEEAKDVPRVPGVMTREEARRLLDALKKDDKKLPSLYVPRQYNVDDEGKRKDW